MSKGMHGDLRTSLSGLFPISEWEDKIFDYVGSQVSQDEETGEIRISQKSYVNTRLETVDYDREADPEDYAGYLLRKDNESVVGALSWLAAQTRPDLQVGVSMAQRRQRTPLLADIKETNRVVRLAQKGKDYGPTYPRLNEAWDELVLLVFHDAAWANVPATASSPDVDEGETAGNMGLVILTSRRVLRGDEGPGLLCTWKSHACPVCAAAPSRPRR